MYFASCGDRAATSRRSALILLAAAVAVALPMAAALSMAVGPTAAAAAPPSHAWSWGLDRWGRLGDGVTTLHEHMEQTGFPAGVCAPDTIGACPTGPYLSGVASIAAGGSQSIALLGDGGVVAWGENTAGQLGDGTHTGPQTCVFVSHEGEAGEPCSATPVPVSGVSEAAAIAAGSNHNLALLRDGTVVAWGANNEGQLGDHNTKSSDVPVPVSGLSDVTAIAAAGNDSLALLGDGNVMAWGANGVGQLGDGSTESSDVPVPVSGLADATAISAGAEHSLALLGDGTAMAWGANNEGQLGDGSTESSDVPVPVSGLSDATAISAGWGDDLALLGDGNVMAWGSDGDGQLGTGGVGSFGGRFEAPAFSDVPVQVCAVGVAPQSLCRSGPYLSGVRAISTGPDHDTAALETGVVSWGRDCEAQLGVGVHTDGLVCGFPEDFAFIPVEAGGELGNTSLVAAGSEYSLAYGANLPTLSNVYPNLGLESGGEQVTLTGSGLSEATAVHFGSVPASSFTVDSPTTITATTPPGLEEGRAPVTITTPAGTSRVPIPADEFYYVPSFAQPVVRSIKPATGPAAGGTTVTIFGSGFSFVLWDSALTVRFGSVSASDVNIGRDSLSAVAPPGTAGAVAVTLTTPGGTSATGGHTVFKYGPPTITALGPSSGSTAGATSVTVTGTGFAVGTAGTIFKFGTTRATSVNCTSTTTCSVLTPAHKGGTVDVTATAGKLTSKHSRPADQFTYSSG
jgi:alpha-tubulin suppressor-like RCC1 family protein